MMPSIPSRPGRGPTEAPRALTACEGPSALLSVWICSQGEQPAPRALLTLSFPSTWTDNGTLGAQPVTWKGAQQANQPPKEV